MSSTRTDAFSIIWTILTVSFWLCHFDNIMLTLLLWLFKLDLIISLPTYPSLCRIQKLGELTNLFTKILRRTCCLTTTSAAVSLSKHGIGYELLQPVTLQTPNRLRAPTALSLSKHRGVTSSYSLSLSKHRTCYELLQLCHSPNTEQDTSTYSLSLSNHRIGYQLLQLSLSKHRTGYEPCHSPNKEQIALSENLGRTVPEETYPNVAWFATGIPMEQNAL